MNHPAKLLDKFVHGFLGYGNAKGSFWFIGMEEGGKKRNGRIRRRLSAWEERGRSEIEDLKEFHDKIGIRDFHKKKPRLQRTWSRLIRIFLTATNGKPPKREQVRLYQQTLWGSRKGETCLLELLPLPSPSTRQWSYKKYSGPLPYLASRDTYEKEVLPGRTKRLKNRIEKHKPKVVILYSFTYVKHWKKLLEVEFPESTDNGAYFVRVRTTLFVIVKHPVGRGIKNEYFNQAGRRIAELLQV